MVLTITSTLHNDKTLIKKNRDSRVMLHIAKETIEDERRIIKNSKEIKSYNKEKMVDNYKVKTLVTSTSYYNCCNLTVKISGMDKEMEFDTYVTKKK